MTDRQLTDAEREQLDAALTVTLAGESREYVYRAVAALLAEAETSASRLPDSIQEALNSGDGVYRP